MAASRLLFGPDSVFVVSFAAAVMLVVVLSAIARQRYGGLTSALTAVFAVAHPVAAAYSMQAMSDVPATLWTAVAVWGMTAARRPRPVMAAVAASLAVLTRPPLLLPMLVLGGAFLRRTPPRTLRFGAVLVAGLVALMALQLQLYGSPFVSGHGGAGQVFSLRTLPHNLAAHGKWFLVVHTPLIVPLLWLGFRSDRWFGRLSFIMAAAVALPYAFYSVPFDDWEMQRFLLPGLALLLPVAAEGVAVILRRVPSDAARPWLAAAVALAVLAGSGRWLEARGVFRLQRLEARYPRVGEWFEQHSPANAIVLASLHSGSVNYYSGRLTLRWDRIAPDRLRALVDAAGQQGRPTYLVLDGSDEVQRFTRRFPAPRLDVRPVTRIVTAEIAELRAGALSIR